jgi:hypothetical protein
MSQAVIFQTSTEAIKGVSPVGEHRADQPTQKEESESTTRVTLASLAIFQAALWFPLLLYYNSKRSNMHPYPANCTPGNGSRSFD